MCWMKRKSRPQIRFKNGAAKAVEGKHNLEVVGSNPTPATNKLTPQRGVSLFLVEWKGASQLLGLRVGFEARSHIRRARRMARARPVIRGALTECAER